MNKLSKFAFAGASLLTLGAIASAQVPGINTNFPTYWHLQWEPATTKATFSTTAYVTPATSATDIFEFVGSATKTVKVRRILINGIATTAVNAPIIIVKRTARDDGQATQAFALPTITSYDTNSPTGQQTATAVMERYSANPTEPASAAAAQVLAERFVALGNLTTTASQFWDMTYGNTAPVLRGTSETLAVNLMGITYAGATIQMTIEWTEE